MAVYPQNRKSRLLEYDLLDFRRERLLVVKKLGKDNRFNQLWECICDCGNTTIATTSALIRGIKKSCGCLNRNTPRRRKPRPSISLGFGIAARNKMIGTYKRQAHKRGHRWDLSLEECLELFAGNCHYCGCPPSNKACSPVSTGMFIYNGIDRLDSNQGYNRWNAVSCCGPCNVRKGVSSLGDFIAWVKSVHDHLSSKGMIL